LELNPVRFTARERLLLLAVVCGAVIGSYFLVYVADGTYIDGHASFWSTGVQGAT
jgi:hypothetical protein